MPPRYHRLPLALVVLSSVLNGCGSSSPAAPTGPANIAGNWSLTITASSVCTTLAPAARSRTWSVAITQSGDAVTMAVFGLASGGTGSFLNGAVNGNAVTGYLYIIESFQSSVYGAWGDASGTASGSRISGTFNGPVGTTGGVSCSAVNHQFIFSR